MNLPLIEGAEVSLEVENRNVKLNFNPDKE
jgi:hypothetical protein